MNFTKEDKEKLDEFLDTYYRNFENPNATLILDFVVEDLGYNKD